ncbi:MAG TPA: hypothetical protein VGN80_12845 [Devosiaceae bacterium]|nr:hypothetical protein [Devosiaceae bacterium]
MKRWLLQQSLQDLSDKETEMADAEDTGTKRLGYPAGHGWERALFGSGSISGTIRMLIYAAAFVLIFGTLFFFIQT